MNVKKKNKNPFQKADQTASNLTAFFGYSSKTVSNHPVSGRHRTTKNVLSRIVDRALLANNGQQKLFTTNGWLDYYCYYCRAFQAFRYRAVFHRYPFRARETISEKILSPYDFVIINACNWPGRNPLDVCPRGRAYRNCRTDRRMLQSAQIFFDE